MRGLKYSLNILEGGLKASEGVLVPAKMTWNVSEFNWVGGNWQYCSKQETPTSLSIKDIDRIQHTLVQMEFIQSITLLGVDIVPNRDMASQREKL